MFRTFETTLAGRPIVVETGKISCLANGSAVVRYGDTVVMTNISASSKPRDGIDFFPLSVDYEEKLYAVGKIPGSFTKREARPPETAILASRAIDRPLRPLFPSDLRNDVCIVSTVLSVEQDNSPEFCAMLGAAIALEISDIPFNGPAASVILGYVDGQFVINPTEEQRKVSQMDVNVCGTLEKIVMIEAGANEIPEDVMFDGIMYAHGYIKELCKFIKEIGKEIGKEKFEYQKLNVNEELYSAIKDFATDKIRYAMDTDDKTVRDARMKIVEEEIMQQFGEQYSDIISTELSQIIYKLQKYIVREWLIKDNKRVDGRGMDEIRPLSAEVSLLPRVHGTGLFTRGQTQVLTVTTLGPIGDAQILDGIDPAEEKRYMHHYNFPSYSVGEARPSRGPGRREIGHGALAERSLVPVLPSIEEFPYTIRLVSEILSSNGSTSQGSVCGSTLSLMDAGVPIKAPVAGISAGLITDENGFKTFVDIQGVEDFFGDMDFKVAGTKKGITSIQVDIKVDGLTPEIIKEALIKTRDARYKIIDDVILKAIPQPRSEVSKYAPKMITMSIHPDKIRDVIGTGGKVIQKIIADTGVKIDIEDDGKVFISGVDSEACLKAQKIIEGITHEITVGEIYLAKVVRIMEFGAFVELLPGKDGLCHISKLDHKHIKKVEDVVNIGDTIQVKVIEIDKMGRINVSRKDLLPPPEKTNKE